MIKFTGQDLTLIGTAIANEIANGKTADETGLLGALLTMIGDAVTLISLKKAVEESKQNNNSNNNNSDNAKSTKKADNSK